MNPFWLFLLLIPFVGFLILAIGMVVYMVKEEMRLSVLFLFIMFSGISGYLLYLLVKSLKKGALLEFPGSDKLDISVTKRITSFNIALTYIILTALAIAIFNVESIRNWVGVIAFFFGVAICLSGLSMLKQAKTFPLKTPVDLELINRQIAMLQMSLSSYVKKRKYVLGSLVLFGVLGVGLFEFLNGRSYLSYFDLLGLLFLLFSTIVLLVLNGIAVRQKLDILKRHARS